MQIATFTRDNPDPAAYRFPIKHQRNRINLLSTLLQLEKLEKGVPLLIEETYLNPRDGLNLLLHLRLKPALHASRAPVFVRLQHDLESHVRHHLKYAILCSQGVTLLREDEEPDVAQVEASKYLSLPQHQEVLEALALRPDELKGRHDLANEWGPHRLWHGYAQLMDIETELGWSDEAFMKLRQQEYYAYLLGLAALRNAPGARTAKLGSQADTQYENFINKYDGPPIQVLLLDDEIEAGWGIAVQQVLERPGKLIIDVSLAGVDFTRSQAEVEAKATSVVWDLVLADLRMGEGDQASLRSVRHLQGAKLIKRIKQEQPDTAVVAFTASNKAWSVQELRELGIDGYWTKESPEFGVDDAYSEANAARLLDTVRGALQPRIEARPIWSLRTELSHLAKQKTYKDGWLPPDAPPTYALEVLGRLNAVVERLDRAYGFMVLATSAHAEEQFKLRRLDLAFLTTWSAINEVIDLYFHGPQSQRRSDELARRPEAAFARRVPAGGKPIWKTYWQLQRGREKIPPVSVPQQINEDKIRHELCPCKGTRKVPVWPGVGADTRKIIWTLDSLGRADLVRSFIALRTLRNKLEEEHGRVGNRKEATLKNVHDICEVWHSLLVVPYEK